jgi:hypothetical protein
VLPRTQTWSSLSAAGGLVGSTLGQAVPTRLSEAVSDPVAAQTCGLSRFQVRLPPTRTQPHAQWESRTHTDTLAYRQTHPQAPCVSETVWLTRRAQRLAVFTALLLAGGACFALALATLPLLVLRPAKFALSYSVGSCLLLGRHVPALTDPHLGKRRELHRDRWLNPTRPQTGK